MANDKYHTAVNMTLSTQHTALKKFPKFQTQKKLRQQQQNE